MSARAAAMERPTSYDTPIQGVALTDSTEADGAGLSGVSWPAIFAGATAAAALSFILIILGFGLGLSSVSPYSAASASATALGIGTIAWLAFTQLAASGLGGYLAGRLRSRWMRLHNDEVYFRDTAHGFLAWCVASLATAVFLGSAIAATLSAGIQAGTGVAAGLGAASVGAASREAGNGQMGYFVDSLLRADGAAPAANSSVAGPSSNATRAEALEIFANDLRAGNLSAEDKTYLGQVVARQTGLSQPDSEKRVTDTFGKVQAAAESAKQAAEAARKAAAHASLWMFVALMCGAFFASLMATLGGRRRDLFV